MQISNIKTAVIHTITTTRHCFTVGPYPVTVYTYVDSAGLDDNALIDNESALPVWLVEFISDNMDEVLDGEIGIASDPYSPPSNKKDG